jgi:hypothetical protein
MQRNPCALKPAFYLPALVEGRGLLESGRTWTLGFTDQGVGEGEKPA